MTRGEALTQRDFPFWIRADAWNERDRRRAVEAAPRQWRRRPRPKDDDDRLPYPERPVDLAWWPQDA